MKPKVDKNEVITATTITEQFTITQNIHIKHYNPIDSNSFFFSVTYQIERQHYHGRPSPLYQLESIIPDEHLVSNEICSDYIRDLLSNCSLKSHIKDEMKDHIVYKISREALNWKNSQKGGYKVEVNVIININDKRNNEVSNQELSNMASCMKSGYETKKKMTIERSRVWNSKISREEIEGCIVHKEVNTNEIQIEYSSVESDKFSFKINYEKKYESNHGNLDGHKVRVMITKPSPTSMDKLEYEFPNQNLISEEACGDQVIKALSEINLLSTFVKYLVEYLSRQGVLWDERNGKGIVHEINVKDNVDWCYEVGCCNGEENACLSRISQTRMAETECVICLKVLLDEVSRIELSCSHLFHEDCVMKWLKNHSSCPLCRTNVVDGDAFFF